jgi:hypothetical protein
VEAGPDLASADPGHRAAIQARAVGKGRDLRLVSLDALVDGHRNIGDERPNQSDFRRASHKPA